jgi:hypothetical protein
MGVYLSGLALVITVVEFTDVANLGYVRELSVIPALIGIVVGIAVAVAARLERGWVPIVMAPFGIQVNCRLGTLSAR